MKWPGRMELATDIKLYENVVFLGKVWNNACLLSLSLLPKYFKYKNCTASFLSFFKCFLFFFWTAIKWVTPHFLFSYCLISPFLLFLSTFSIIHHIFSSFSRARQWFSEYDKKMSLAADFHLLVGGEPPPQGNHRAKPKRGWEPEQLGTDSVVILRDFLPYPPRPWSTAVLVSSPTCLAELKRLLLAADT